MPDFTLNDIGQLLDEKLDVKLKPIYAQLDFLTENMATKDDLVSEIRPIKSQLAIIETKIDRISVRSNEDVVATMKDLEKVSGRVKVLEKDVAQLKLAEMNK